MKRRSTSASNNNRSACSELALISRRSTVIRQMSLASGTATPPLARQTPPMPTGPRITEPQCALTPTPANVLTDCSTEYLQTTEGTALLARSEGFRSMAVHTYGSSLARGGPSLDADVIGRSTDPVMALRSLK